VLDTVGELFLNIGITDKPVVLEDVGFPCVYPNYKKIRVWSIKLYFVNSIRVGHKNQTRKQYDMEAAKMLVSPKSSFFVTTRVGAQCLHW